MTYSAPKHRLEAALAQVDGFAARASARALRVDLGRRDPSLPKHLSWLLGGGSWIDEAFWVNLYRSRGPDPRGQCL